MCKTIAVIWFMEDQKWVAIAADGRSFVAERMDDARDAAAAALGGMAVQPFKEGSSYQMGFYRFYVIPAGD